MLKKTATDIVQNRYVTEKARVLEGLHKNTKNPSVRKCETPKYTFLVDRRANKQEIAAAVEEIYAEKGIKVLSVNTIHMKPKLRRVRGRAGMRPQRKKAIVTLRKGDVIEDKV